MNELGGYAFADLRVGMCATFAKTVTEANIVLFAARAALPMDCCRQA
jgi:3-hydroxybutyryl-CoA dehydratase